MGGDFPRPFSRHKIGLKMSLKTEIVITHDDASVDAVALLQVGDSSNKWLFINKLINFFRSIGIGQRRATVKMQVAATQASSTLTLDEVAADDTAVINGTTFTAKVSPSTSVQFALGSTDAEAAAALVAAVNAHATIGGLVQTAVTSTETQEVTSLTCVADVAGSLDGKYFVLADEGGTVGFWIDVDNGGGSAPTTGATRDVEITTITTGMTAAQVAGVVATAINADTKFTAARVGTTAVVTVTCDEPAVVADFAAGDAGFTATVSTQGVDAVVTVTAIDPGVGGNAITLTATGGITAGAAKLESGANGTEKTYTYGSTAPSTTKTELVITHEDSSVDALDIFQGTSIESPAVQIRKLVKYFKDCRLGLRNVSIKLQTADVQATGTFTGSSVVATNTVVINGTTLTCVNSGATTEQWNKGADDTATMAALASKINGHATLSLLVSASAALSVCTITALDPGPAGNAISTTASGAITADQAKLTSGANANEKTYYFGGAS